MAFLSQDERLRRRAVAWAVRLKVNPRIVRVEHMRGKWGSCSAAGDVTLADDLTSMDERFQDYVIVHELLHLRLPTHSKRFKALMTAYVPEWRRLEAEVRDRRAGASTGSHGRLL